MGKAQLLIDFTLSAMAPPGISLITGLTDFFWLVLPGRRRCRTSIFVRVGGWSPVRACAGEPEKRCSGYRVGTHASAGRPNKGRGLHCRPGQNDSDSVCLVACILQPRQCSANQPSKLLGICRFPGQWPTRPGQVIKWGDQARCPLTRFSVAPAHASQTHGLAAVVA